MKKYPQELVHRLDNTFDAFFNEWGEHSAFSKQRDAAKKLLLSAEDESSEEKLMLFYAAMRLIQFIVSPSNQNAYDTENMATAAG